MDGGAWWAAVHGVSESDMTEGLSTAHSWLTMLCEFQVQSKVIQLHTHTHTHVYIIYTLIYSFSNSFPIWVITESWAEFLVVYSRSSLLIHLKYTVSMCQSQAPNLSLTTTFPLMLGKIEGRRRRGWQRLRWLDGITNLMDMNWSGLWGDGQGGLACCSPRGCKELDTSEWMNWISHWVYVPYLPYPFLCW